MQRYSEGDAHSQISTCVILKLSGGDADESAGK